MLNKSMSRKSGLQLLTDKHYISCFGDSLVDREKNILALVQDISDLLNTKIGNIQVVGEKGVEDFIVNYGLPELGYYSPYSLEDRAIVSDLIKNCLIRFEPRLKSVSVTPISEDCSMIFHYKIKGVIDGDYGLIPLVLDSRINTLSKEILLTRD